MKVIPSEEVVSQHYIIVSDVEIKHFKLETLFQKERFWKLNERDVKENFANRYPQPPRQQVTWWFNKDFGLVIK